MDTSKIIKGVVNSGRYTVTAPIVKEDYGLYLKIEGVELPSTYEVDFSNSENNGTSVTMIGNSDGVLIPRQFIDSGKDVFAFLYHVGEDFGRTVYKFRIPNKVRPDRTDETPTPEEQSVIDQAINALNEAVAQTAQDVIDADASAQSASADADRAEQAKEDASTFAQRSANSAQASADYSASAQASATASANSASASAQIKADVEDLVDDAQASASASAQSATTSANSASQAQGYAQSASASANSASGYASQADISANTASAKASEASTSAQTASNKASEASQSASQALSYKTDAESAKTASQTAQGLAESARDSAVQAKTDAESAKDDAESARDEAQQAVASISGALAEKAPVITDTASGSIASFSDGADDLPLKSLVVDINPVQDLSHGDPSPENICPISGWTSVDVEQSGVNVWDEKWEVGGIRTADGTLINEQRIRPKNLIPCVPNTTYYILDPTNNDNIRVFYYAEDGSYIGCTSFIMGAQTTPNNARFMRFIVATTYGTTYNHDISINYPSTDHDYHPYTGRSITISLGQTVYGGHLDVVSGLLTVDRAMVDLGTLNWAYSGGSLNHRFSAIMPSDYLVPSSASDRANVVCSCYASNPSIVASTSALGISGYQGSTTIFVRDLAYSDNNSFKSAVNGEQLVYRLATPIEMQLSANQINSLLGVNNIWADSGDTEVEYRADTKLYIERLTAPDSADMIADANITSGQYFMVGNSLYKATANIANGSAIVVGTNCIRKSLSEALNEVNA